jgi:hypothetical protein
MKTTLAEIAETFNLINLRDQRLLMVRILVSQLT